MTTTAPVASAAQPLTRRQIITVFVGLMTGLLLSSLDNNIMSTAIPTIVGDLGGLNHVAWVGTAYLLTSTSVTPLYGKLSDLFGRRVLFQAAIVLFMIGSVGAGLAQTMTQLVVSRGVQGLGGGGLMAMAFVVIGDIVPPRDRGRYVGMFTAVFAFSSVAGPLLGGFFVDNLSWRWIFWINLPLGVVALVVTTTALRLPFATMRRRIDLLGATLMVGSVSSLVLLTTWGGNEFAWDSPVIFGLGAAALVLGVLFVVQERRAEEPILPLRLFSNSIFSLVTVIGLTLGTVMFGATYFLPLFLQVVSGASATNSGLLLVPLMAGVTLSSITVGRLTSTTGRYKKWPIIGLALVLTGLALLAMLDVDTSRAFTSGAMFVLGLGMGMTLPTITLAVQNSVEWRDLGAATSAVTFFRSLGGAVGLAAFGALFNARLRSGLADALPPGSPIDPEQLLQSPKAIAALDPPLQAAVAESVAGAVSHLFVVAVPVVAVAFVAAWFVKELPLRETSALQRSHLEEAVAGG